MSLTPVTLYEVRCDGCSGRMEYGDEYTCWAHENISEWLLGCDWREEDGKHYCCHEARVETTSRPRSQRCWPPSMRDESFESSAARDEGGQQPDAPGLGGATVRPGATTSRSEA